MKCSTPAPPLQGHSRRRAPCETFRRAVRLASPNSGGILSDPAARPDPREIAIATPSQPNPIGLPDRTTLVAFLLVVVLGGANAVAVRFSNFELPPFWGATLRFGATALVFWAIVAGLRVPVPHGLALRGAVLYGLVGIGASYAFLYWSLTRVQAGMATVVLALVPLLTFLLAVLHRLEPYRWSGLLGSAVAFIGIGLSLSGELGGAVPVAHLLALIAGGVCIAESAVLIKLHPRADPVSTNAVAVTAGTAVLLPLSILAGEPRDLPAEGATWAAFLYLVVIGSLLLFYLILFVLQRWTASATAYTFLLFPVVTVVLGAWLAGETVSPSFLAGAAIVVGGVWLGAFSPLERRPARAV